MENQIEKKSTFSAWVWMVLAGVYTISPIDIIPDIPVVGWIDDFLITATSLLNLIQAQCQQSNAGLANIAKILKWIVIIGGVIIILLVLLLGTLIVSLFVK